MIAGGRCRTCWRAAGVIVLAAVLTTAPAAAQNAADVKAAFLYNFAKFTEWPALEPAAPISFCVVSDDEIAAALVQTFRGQNISGHPLQVVRPQDGTTWRGCQLLFIAGAESRRSSGGLASIKTLPVLTVSDGKGFIDAGGMIEFYVEDGRMRFAINPKAIDQTGLHLSSRLLGLAKIEGRGDVR
jgi:hypothetical protein